jgi:hypothetical protein
LLTALVRNLLVSFLRAVQNRDFESALDLVEPGDVAWSPLDLEGAARQLFAEGVPIRLDAQGRSPTNTRIEPDGELWHVTQSIILGDEISEYGVRGRVNVARSTLERRAVFELDHFGVL